MHTASKIINFLELGHANHLFLSQFFLFTECALIRINYYGVLYLSNEKNNLYKSGVELEPL